LYYSGQNLDFATVLNYNMTVPGYEYIGIQGYVFPTQQLGTLPLGLWWSSKRKDFYTVGSLAGKQDAQNNDYQFIGYQGYAYPGPYWSAPLPPN
jgi:hypothetical protein